MLQSDLDDATERLSHMLEHEDGADRSPLVECTSHARKRLANFVEGVEQGVLSQTNAEWMVVEQAAQAAKAAKSTAQVRAGGVRPAADGSSGSSSSGGSIENNYSSGALAALAAMGFADPAANAAALASVGGSVDEAA